MTSTNGRARIERQQSGRIQNGYDRELPPTAAYQNDPEVVSSTKGKTNPRTSTHPTIGLRHAADIVAERRAPHWLLKKIIETSVVAVLAGPRGTFKSFIALHWAMLAALAGKSVVILSAEGAGIDRRIDAWMRVYAADRDLRDLSLFVVERQFALSAPEQMNKLCTAIDAAKIKPDFIVVDTFSKYTTGIDENDNTEVANFLAFLSASLRDRYRATVLLVAHTGHQNAKRPRGAYALMANPDGEYIVDRSKGKGKGMTVTVSRDRFKDSESLPPLVYEARVVDLGRTTEDGEAVTSLVLAGTDTPECKPNATGANQRTALVALREWARTNPDAPSITSVDISAVLKARGIDSKRKPEVLEWLEKAGVISSVAAGFTVNKGML